MSILDEQVLSQRLHEDLGALAAPLPPVGTVLHRGRGIRARRWAWAAAASGLMAGAAAVALAVSTQTGSPAARPAAARTGAAPGTPAPGASSPAVGLNSAPPPGGNAFAAGATGGAAWQLSLRNIAGRGASCLPAVMLNGTDGDLLSSPADPSQGIISTAFLDNAPDLPSAGYAALQVAPAVTRLTAIFRNGTTLTVHPVPLRACGQQLHLAGFAYPASGVAQITAYSRGQFASTARETPPAAMFHGAADSGGSVAGQPSLRMVPGVWEHMGAMPPDRASGTVGSGQLAGGRWRITLTLGATGECFAGSSFGAGSYTSGTACQPIGLPPVTAVLRPLTFAGQPRLAGYGGVVSSRAVTVTAALSNGTTERIAPVTVGGRNYLALALAPGTTLTRLVLLDRSGHAFATVTSIPPGG